MPDPAPAHMAPDAPVVRANTDFLDIHLYSAQYQQDRVMWQTDGAQLGLFVQDQVPYLLVHFPNHQVTFDCPFNIRRVSENIRTIWIKSDQSTVGLILASYPTNCFYGMQRVGVNWATELRRIAQLTMDAYPTADAVERQQRLIEARFSTAQMWQQQYQR
ncbi:hypothetical protein CLV58_115102 [Spirosoma oryzae]|uniref:Uncharacterized protein n=2 Tax=Spirosoma oryzae TaxID=1469603 RepID=A0A2T0SNM6_9BACT|nr:hypothetical protein CLV58_115102 [Spirosoma oryzae]